MNTVCRLIGNITVYYLSCNVNSLLPVYLSCNVDSLLPVHYLSCNVVCCRLWVTHTEVTVVTWLPFVSCVTTLVYFHLVAKTRPYSSGRWSTVPTESSLATCQSPLKVVLCVNFLCILTRVFLCRIVFWIVLILATYNWHLPLIHKLFAIDIIVICN